MYELIIKEQFDKSFSKIKDVKTKKQIWNKILELKTRAPIGKKLVANPYWSIHIGKIRTSAFQQNRFMDYVNLILLDLLSSTRARASGTGRRW